MYQLFYHPRHITMTPTQQILEDIELAIEDEATIEFSELVGPNSLEYHFGLEDHVERRIAQFHEALYTSIQQEIHS